MRRAGGRLLPLRILFVLFFPPGGLRGAVVQHVHRGLVRGQRFLPGQRREHGRIQAGLPQLRRQPGAGLVHPARRDRHPQQHGHDLRGPLRRHVPVRRQHHRGGVQHRPVGHRARVRARRRLRERDRPAARAAPARQRPLGHRPDDLHVGDLRPPRSRSRRTVQGRPASAALRRRPGVLLLTRVRIPLKAFPLMTRLASPLAILPALALGLLPRPPRLFRPDPLLRGRRPGVGAVHRQAALDFRQPQLQPALPVQRRFQGGRQHGDLLVLRPDHSPQPRDQVSLLASRPRLIGHEPQACSTCTKSSTTAARRRVCHAQPREWTRARPLPPDLGAGPGYRRDRGDRRQ